ncbi:MAG: hypothetical protein D6714_16820 [Bacteroidetes bacterium]|nr:MAG: hypothetical protein D6714_16820 [Bacteroidota bacterium]
MGVRGFGVNANSYLSAKQYTWMFLGDLGKKRAQIAKFVGTQRDESTGSEAFSLKRASNADPEHRTFLMPAFCSLSESFF